MEFEILLLTYKPVNSQAPSYLEDLMCQYFPNKAVCSQAGGLLPAFLRFSKLERKVGLAAFRYTHLDPVSGSWFWLKTFLEFYLILKNLSFLPHLKLYEGSLDHWIPHNTMQYTKHGLRYQ